MKNFCTEKVRRRLASPAPGMIFTYLPTHGIWPIKDMVLAVYSIRKGQEGLPRREEEFSPHPCVDNVPNTFEITLADHIRTAT